MDPPVKDLAAHFKNLEVEDDLPSHLVCLLAKEKRWTSFAGGLNRHPGLVTRMRTILVDWLMEVSREYHLDRMTLHRAVLLLDHFLWASRQHVSRHSLQLVGLTCTLLACKFEEIAPPDMDAFVYICDDTYERGDIIDMEAIILRDVGWDLCQPTAYEWLEWWLCGAAADDALNTFTQTTGRLSRVCRALLDATLLTTDCLMHSPSTLAKACLYAGQMVVGAVVQGGAAPTNGLALQILTWGVDQAGPSKLEGLRSLHQRDDLERVHTTGKLLLSSPQGPSPTKKQRRGSKCGGRKRKASTE